MTNTTISVILIIGESCKMKGKTLTIDLTEKEMDALKIIIKELVPDSPNMS